MDARSFIAMALDRAIDSDDHPQLATGCFLEAIGFPVPRLEAAFPESGLLFYEDLGDTLLQDLARDVYGDAPPPPTPDRASPSERAGANAAEVDRLYLEAVRLILILQGSGTRTLPSDHPSARSALDRARLLFELEFFREHYVERLRGIRLDPAEARDLTALFEVLAAAAASPPHVLCHRDYHSRNLLIKEGRVRVVDFQDARLGPVTYDLVSLVRDSYVVVPEAVRSRLIAAFLEACEAPMEEQRFRESFDTVALQRNLKAIGTFAYQSAVLGKDRYLPSIPTTWTYVFDELGRLPGFAGADSLLARLAPL